MGLLLTTGGNNGAEDLRSVSVAMEIPKLRQYDDETLPRLRRAVEGGQISARLIPLADLQAPGGTPTPTPAELAYNEGAEEVGALDGVVYRLQAPLEPQYGSLGRTAELICAYPWPQGCDYWIAIARCESDLSPNAVGYMGRYVGLFQVWLGHGYEYSWLLDPPNNVLAAWELSHEGTRTSPWPYCQWQ